MCRNPKGAMMAEIRDLGHIVIGMMSI